MKRVKSEDIQSAVLQYLKKRQYSDSDTTFKKEQKLSQTVSEMAVQGAVMSESGVSTSFTFSSCDPDPTLYEDQYSGLKVLIDDAPQAHQSELTVLLYPMFVHLHLDLVCNGHRDAAEAFFTRHHGNFLVDNMEWYELIEELAGVMCKQDLFTKPKVKAFRETKYAISLSDKAFQYLLRYLQSDDNLILLRLFNTYLHVNVKPTQNGDLDLYSDKKGGAQEVTMATPPHTPDNKVQPGDVTQVSLQDCIRRVREGTPYLSSVCLYTFHNTFQGLNTAAVSDDSRFVCGGFDDSTVKVWSGLSRKLKAAHHTVDVSRINLAGDVLDDKVREDSVGQEVKHMRGHSGPVYGTSFLPNNTFLLTSSEDTTVRLWNLSTFTNDVIYKGHSYPVWDIDTSPLGAYFVSCSQDRSARLWALDRTFPLRIFAGHSQDVDCVKFHPNCNYIATGSSDRTVRLWSVQDGKFVRIFHGKDGHKGTIFSLAFSPDGKHLASAGEDNCVRVWDLTSGDMLKELRAHTDSIYSISYSRDGTMLASAGGDSIVRVWDMRPNIPDKESDGQPPELLHSYPTKTSSLHMLKFAPSDLLIAAGTAKGDST
ncbi:TAF5-like RNA polymerase II p300/CBP-associated factor-associated factor 65 kDa subunit 5L [Branchiostoma floridae]|uniref:TAF5-like RNA polymerase II p300/CBP-associated factor-associated factor 65 kDa subunit 5L n=1 Tax=Branchiostoma floridae TaxID=7739 RepID=C3ZSP8_BRAFL|nr:TAF5-like RNA polymerase II p300/CBP-associated factor-associated factor 65 kDa subunit 5L [Branchiostoma floridae]|eukprot:XP_002588439.1 hypothetical protein BRAFLDRAFT_274913 [Branchiostoma floridae]